MPPVGGCRRRTTGSFRNISDPCTSLAKELTTSQAEVWADINNDRLFDPFAGDESARALLYLNKGD
jgi:hypothetical protein